MICHTGLFLLLSGCQIDEVIGHAEEIEVTNRIVVLSLGVKLLADGTELIATNRTRKGTQR